MEPHAQLPHLSPQLRVLLHHLPQQWPCAQVVEEGVLCVPLLRGHCWLLMGGWLLGPCLRVEVVGPGEEGVPHVVAHEVEEGPAGELVEEGLELEVEAVADAHAEFVGCGDVPDGPEVAQRGVGAEGGDGAGIEPLLEGDPRAVADFSEVVEAHGESGDVLLGGEALYDFGAGAPGDEAAVLLGVLDGVAEEGVGEGEGGVAGVGERCGAAPAQQHQLNEGIDQKQRLMSSSQRPTVTGHTLKPLARSLAACAVSLVAMLFSSCPMSTSTFHSRSASTLARCTTFWSKVCLLPISFHMQVSPPMTLTEGTLGSQEYILRQCSQAPQTLPYMLLKPMSRQVRSQFERITSFLRPTMRPTLALTPHQSITSSSCRGRSMSSLAQQITFLLAEMLRHTAFCCWRQQTARAGQSATPCAAIQSRMLWRCPQHSKVTSSPPKCTYSSSAKVAFTYFITSVISSQVSGSVGSNCPMYSPLQFSVVSANRSLRPQDSVWAGESISGMTRMARVRAQAMTCWMSSPEKTPPTLPAPLSSGREGTCMGKASSSTMCQCSTLSLEQTMESMARRMVSRGRKCLEVSIISPRHLKEGESLTEMGSPLTPCPPSPCCSSCEKVSSPLRKPGQKGAASSHWRSVPSSSEYCSCPTWVGTSRELSCTAMRRETCPEARMSLHLNTLVRYQPSISSISALVGASTMYSMSQALTRTLSPSAAEEKWRGLGQRASAGPAAMSTSTARVSRSCFIREQLQVLLLRSHE